MVEADLAELVDDDRRLGKRRVLDQPVEQAGLAGAEKPGQHREGKGSGRLAGTQCVARWAHC
jgi:hypothetical protein